MILDSYLLALTDCTPMYTDPYRIVRQGRVQYNNQPLSFSHAGNPGFCAQHPKTTEWDPKKCNYYLLLFWLVSFS